MTPAVGQGRTGRARKLGGRALRILVVLPSYRQPEPTGALVTTREYVRGLVAAGHAVQVVTTSREPERARTEDGVKVWPLANWRYAVQKSRPQLVISHYRDRRAAQIIRQLSGIAHLLMVHGMPPQRDLGRPDLAWFPSQACRDHYPDYRGPSLVLPPPIDPGRYRTTPGGMVTLNGSTAAKGADVLARIAEQLPETRFLVVATPGKEPGPLPQNVQVAERADPRDVYARTRILLMPSELESYGRAGVEAMLSGIPVLAAPLPGIREALGDAATYVPRGDTDAWAREIRRLSDPDVYAAASTRARVHAEGLDYEGNLRLFDAACRRAVLHRSAGARVPARPTGTLRLGSADVVAWVHFGVPYRRAGSETMLHTMMAALAEEGLNVVVVCSAMPEAPSSWREDGVTYRSMEAGAAEALIRHVRPKAVITHHDFAERAIALSKETGSRSVLLFHNDFDLPARAYAYGPDLCVYNTEWVRASLASRYVEADRIRSLVVHPPVIPEEHRAPREGTNVTLVNLSRHKGVATWRGAAAVLPALPFLGVMGAHGPQVTRPVRRNMTVIRQTSDMRGDVWARTRVLMVPSVYESYGMAAVEALASGIPVIAHPTTGLQEALGDAGTFIDRADVRGWAKAIKGLYQDGDRRAEASARARARSAFLADQTSTEMKLWVNSIHELAETARGTR
ncbi:glycosyltransferase family 4 protein [Streptomyces europaeiscabiei]|uniref:glycosyltransferase family 4 protein n=1 Tax=Streptomyces europaeiscabiei TaxID=146819 RepID=UPI002E11EDF2|nr:glycosyltransferase family 4 protein [Streptomyces europaeiscabiei]